MTVAQISTVTDSPTMTCLSEDKVGPEDSLSGLRNTIRIDDRIFEGS